MAGACNSRRRFAALTPICFNFCASTSTTMYRYTGKVELGIDSRLPAFRQRQAFARLWLSAGDSEQGTLPASACSNQSVRTRKTSSFPRENRSICCRTKILSRSLERAGIEPHSLCWVKSSIKRERKNSAWACEEQESPSIASPQAKHTSRPDIGGQHRSGGPLAGR
jgi:hypothetical protein